MFGERGLLPLQAVAEEEYLIFDGVQPVGPVMGSRTSVEVVRNSFFHELFVEVAVHFKEEIFGAAVKYDVEGARLQEVGQIDDSVIFPFLRIFLDGAQAALDVPVVGERTDIHSSRHAAGRTECVLMPECDEKCSMATH